MANTKTSSFGVNILFDIKAVIILTNITEAAKFSGGGMEIAKAQHKIRAKYRSTTFMMTRP